MSRVVRVFVAGALAVGLTLGVSRPTRAANTGPFTLPFFKPDLGVTQDYGCTGFQAEPAYGNCAHYHAGIDYGLDIDTPVASSRAGTVVSIVDGNGDNTSGQCPPPGNPSANFVVIRHSSNRYSIYLHLEAGSVLVGQGEHVAAGQKIAESGNSGISCGGHLHYQLSTSTSQSAGNSLDPGGKWTTDDNTELQGRVPWRGRLINWWGENTADCLADHSTCFRTLHIPQGDTATFWLEFKNIGGRTWARTSPPDTDNDSREWRVFLGSSIADGSESRNSAFEATDWIDYGAADDWRISVSDELTVKPDENGTFTFGLRAAQAQGYSATEHFNLRAESLRWFKLTLKPDADQPGWDIDSIDLPITIMAPPPPP